MGVERRAWGAGEAAPASAWGRRRLSAGAAISCSTSVFQLPQLAQRPKNWRVWAAQLLQT
jgi:hypothetical protein